MKTKLVIWDLDNTLWQGTLAEKDNLTLYDKRFEIIKQLNSKGIMNSICSKNNFNEAKDFLIQNNFWENFVFPKIEFAPKGQIVKSILDEMHLRAENTIFIDDSSSNLEEVKYYNPDITVLNEANCEKVLLDIIESSKEDENLSRLHQYKQLERKTNIQKTFSSNEDFLIQSNISVEFINYNDSLFDRLYELCERTNQLNFTKNRMSKDELKEMVKDSSIKTQLIHATDNFGDYGLIGFYSIKDNSLIHFVFSCRIMNMGIEQFVYEYLEFPKIKIVGDVASTLEKTKKINYIKILKNNNEIFNENIKDFLSPESEVNIFGIGACDLFHPIAYFSLPNIYFQYECNVFVGNKRGVNVGTQYLRSQLEMTNEQKKFCTEHFYNYTRFNVFKSEIYDKRWDYIIMSFHDDMAFKIYRNKANPNFSVTLDIIGKYDVINTENPEKWLEDNFEEGYYISPEEFIDNMLFISEHVNQKAKIILINGPELNYYRESIPVCEPIRKQIIKINKAIDYLGKNYSQRFSVVDINKVVKSKEDVTNYVFHLKANTAYNLFKEIAQTMVDKFPLDKPPMLGDMLKNRKLCIFSKNETEASRAYYNLKLGGNNPEIFITEENWENYIGKNNEYFIVIADSQDYLDSRALLLTGGYKPVEDFVQLKPIEYKKFWQDFKEFLIKNNIKERINNLADKYKNKRIALYGAGQFATVLFENYDLSKFNIVAVCDKKFEDKNIKKEFFGINCITPDELKDFDCDLILISNYKPNLYIPSIKNLIHKTKNASAEIAVLYQE